MRSLARTSCSCSVRWWQLPCSRRTRTPTTSRVSPTSSRARRTTRIASLEKAVAANPKHGMAWVVAGQPLQGQGDIPKAVAAYESATAVIKKGQVLWANLGMAYYRNDQVDKGARGADHRVQARAERRRDPRNLGTVRRKKGDTAGAIIDLEMATKLKPDDANYWNNLGVAYRTAKRDDDAIKSVPEGGRALAPTTRASTFNLAVTYRRRR